MRNGCGSKIAPKSVFNGKTYYFCSDDDKKTFDTAPDKFVSGNGEVMKTE